jgi:hypothetical protein
MGHAAQNTAHFFKDSVNAIASACPGRGQPFLGALADQISFELGETGR